MWRKGDKITKKDVIKKKNGYRYKFFVYDFTNDDMIKRQPTYHVLS